MGTAIKYLLILLGVIVALMAVAIVSFVVLFDPNDFKERIAADTKAATGRDLVIEGDLNVSLFPWLAIDVGKTTLGNAAGFGDEPFATFESAKLSVRLMPMLTSREVSIGTAELDSLRLNLAVARDGTTNWDDFAEPGGVDVEVEHDASAAEAAFVLDIASINVRDSALTYTDAQAGTSYRLTDINMTSGRVAAGESVPLEGGLAFDLQPDGLSGRIDIDTTATFDTDAGAIDLADLVVEAIIEGLADVPTTIAFRAPAIVANTEAQTLAPGELELTVFDVDIEADVEPFSYAGDPQPSATLSVAAFSPQALMRTLNIEVPPTADPNALGKLRFDAKAAVGASSIALSDVELVLDDTTMTGSLSLPKDPGGSILFEFVADEIDLARYMAPAEEAAAASADAVPVEIPVDLIRALNARGSLKVAEGRLGELEFTDVDLGLNSANGRLRLNPISANLYDGTYNGDVRIDASGATPSVSVNEQIADVSIGSLIRAMFDQDNVTGTINGSFVLAGSGPDLTAIQQDLDGNISLELVDGAFEGIDVWHEIRKARALFRQEPAPQAKTPARTQFSNVRAAGPVADGVFTNPDFLAEMPFMQVSGRGTVNFAAATMDYRLNARVLEKPELMSGVSEEELGDLTKAVIPVRINGPLAAPSIAPDIEGLLKEAVRQELEDRGTELLDRLLGGGEEAPAEEGTEAAEGAEATDGEEAPPEEEKSLEDEVKDRLLKKIFE